MFCLPAMKLMFIIFKWSHFYILNKGMFAERTKRLEANNVTEDYLWNFTILFCAYLHFPSILK